MIKVASHIGTGSEIVKTALQSLGGRVTFYNSTKKALKADFDRLILLGGSDIRPLYYGQENRHCYGTDKERDSVEWVLIKRALDLEVPIFGICRGHQMINIACGGSLYQDIAKEKHSAHGSSRHNLSFVDPLLAPYLPTYRVNSLHHQAIKTPAPGFEVLAETYEGVAEAIWNPRGILGVQFHPELMLVENPGWIDLFRWFMAGFEVEAYQEKVLKVA